MGMDKQTNRQTKGWTNGRTDKWTNIYSIFREKLSFPEGSSDSKVFEIYTDAYNKQLGAIITQDNRPIVFFSWKLSNTQPNTVSPKLNY
jgi:hypothetical protein